MQRKLTLPFPLQPQQLYQACDLGQFEFQTTAELTGIRLSLARNMGKPTGTNKKVD